MSSPYESLFGTETLTGLIRTFDSEPGNRACTQVFARNAKKLMPVGTLAKWDEVVGSRHLAPITGSEEPAPRQANKAKTTKTSAMADIRVSKFISGDRLFDDRAPGKLLPSAEDVIAEELMDLNNLIGNTKEFLCASALLGTITVNSSTVPGSTMSFTVSFSPQSLSAGASWATASTKIISDEIKDHKQTYKDASGFNVAEMLIDPSIEGYLQANTEAQAFVSNALGSNFLLNGGTLEGAALGGLRFGGLSWTVTDGVYKPEGGSVTRYKTVDQAIMLPSAPQQREVLGWIEGYGKVPAGPVYTANGRGAVRQASSRGNFAYAMTMGDPVGVKLIAGWVGLPVLLNPNGVGVLDTTP